MYSVYHIFHSISDIQLGTTADQMKTLLETNFDVGQLKIYISNGYPKCNHYRWKVDWLTKSGKQPDLIINASKVMGHNIQVRNNIREGGLFYKKIPGEFLRVISREPQVSGLGLEYQQISKFLAVSLVCDPAISVQRSKPL